MLWMSKEFDISWKGRIAMNDIAIELLGYLAMGFILFCLGSILWMVVSMARRGDERRREIVARAGCTTLYITLGSLGIDIFWGVYNAVANGVPVEGNNPFVQLSVISFTYAIGLAVYRRKYGG